MSGKGSEARLTHGGDPRFRELVRAMDREYGERFGAAALKCRSCHGLDDIRQACLLLRDGQVVACGTPEEIAACPASYTGQYLKSVLNNE